MNQQKVGILHVNIKHVHVFLVQCNKYFPLFSHFALISLCLKAHEISQQNIRNLENTGYIVLRTLQ